LEGVQKWQVAVIPTQEGADGPVQKSLITGLNAMIVFFNPNNLNESTHLIPQFQIPKSVFPTHKRFVNPSLSPSSPHAKGYFWKHLIL
jgi:hypothetical protein